MQNETTQLKKCKTTKNNVRVYRHLFKGKNNIIMTKYHRYHGLNFDSKEAREKLRNSLIKLCGTRVY